MKRNITVAALAAVVLVGGGLVTTAAFADSDSGTKEDRTAGADRAAGSPGTPGKARISVDEAVDAALKAVPGTVTEAELDDDDDDRDRAVWELDVYGSDRTRNDVKVDARSGKVLSERKDDDNDDRDRHAPRRAGVSLDAAVRAALADRPGTVTSVDLDDDGEDGGEAAPHWDVDVTGEDGGGHELHVDAKSGKVTADRADDDSDSDD
ncbi:PepSY domain-containing protein [Streptomyces sp. NPDC057428]|uniref:PepSY domain-containing protein n=1 Tax=Streptomyces sp. NPDC057428 TaxID=3346129 RepID=UPI0036811E0D